MAVSMKINAPQDLQRRRLIGAAIGGLALGSASARGLAATRTMPRGVDLIGAPSNLGLRPLRPGHVPGARRAPAALRAHGIVRRLGADDRGDVAAPAYDPSPDPATGYRNGVGLAAYTPALADRVGESLDRGRFAFVLGGDCSVLLGGALALRRRGRYGLLFIDGHSDFYFPRVPRPLSAAGMDLALATGHGPDAIANIEGRSPYFREEDTVVFGYRDRGTADEVEIERFDRAAFTRIPLERVRELGVAKAVADAKHLLENPALDGFWIHLDVDVLDPTFMPAVDSPDPGGMMPEQLEQVLAVALSSPRLAGMEMTIYDPDLDADGHLADRLVALLARAFERAGTFAAQRA